MALAVRRGAGVDGHVAAGLDPRYGGLEATRAHNLRRAKGADLDIAREPDAAQLALLAQLGGLGLESLETGHFHRLVERHRVVAAVVGQADGRRVRKLVLLDEVSL